MKIKEFVKKEVVLCVATVLAVISAFVVLPDKQYVDYIDFRTLGILLCLMCVMAGLQGMGLFRIIAQQLLTKVKTLRGIVGILVLLCFFFSMLITNDVALITFVPFTFTVLEMLDQRVRSRQLIPIVVLQTIAANLGSMLTPIGNPQNLYLYGKAGLGMGEFLSLMLPYTAVSLVVILLLACCRKGLGERLELDFARKAQLEGRLFRLIVYLVLFVVCLLAV
ncbi:MAG: anion permease, partial [Lachnospiraceae bacterium]|nr:anion permease [Lachnospiraceae bacterium]